MSLLLLLRATGASAGSLAGTGTLTGGGFVKAAAQANLAGTGTLTARIIANGQANLAGQGTVTANPHNILAGQATLAGAGTTTATGSKVAAWSSSNLAGTSGLSATPVSLGTAYRVLVCDSFGVLYGELEQAKVGDVTWGLNRPDTWTFTIPATDPKAHLLFDERLREVQIWRGDRLLTWGPIIRPQADPASITVTGAGALWLLGRRTISRLPPTEYVTNGGFEQGLTAWTFTWSIAGAYSGVNPAVPPPHSIVTSPVLVGARALTLDVSNVGADQFGAQTFNWTVQTGSPYGDVFTARGYAFVPSSTYVGPVFSQRGLTLLRYSTTELDPDPVIQQLTPGAKKNLQVESATIDDNTPKDTWVRQEVSFTLLPKGGEAETIQIKIYAPRGGCFWDAVSLTRDESLTLPATDQAEIVRRIVVTAQDTTLGKSDLNIATLTPATGVLRNRTYRFSEHTGALTAIDEFTSLSNGVDVSMRYTPTTRTLVTHSQRQGAYRPAAALVLRKNMSDWRWTFDGEAAATVSVVLGEGSGADREAGIAVDTSTFSRNVVLEDVQTAPIDTPIDSLDKLAVEALAVARAPEVVEATTVDAGLLGRVDIGDFVPVQIVHGDLAVNATYRVVALTLDAVADRLKLTLNRRDP